MTTLGKYELHEQLGRGGFGTVYRAIDTTLGREVALKVLHPQLTTDPDFLERFRNEAKLVASLDSPNIVTIYELGEVDGRVFIAMKYLPGGSLKQRLEKEGALPFDEAVKIIQDVCSGLEAAHQKGLVHRDIKPGNILFDSNGRAVLGDFGLARAIQMSNTSSSSSIGGAGTPAYRAPELWVGKPPASPATDIYSLGCVLSEMLTGAVLFDGDTTDVVLTQHLSMGARISDSLPREVRQILKKSLAKDPQSRYQNVADFIAAVSAVNPKQKEPQEKTLPFPWKKVVIFGVLGIIGIVSVILLIDHEKTQDRITGVPTASTTPVMIRSTDTMTTVPTISVTQIEYTVRSGDTLQEIADKFQVSKQAIMDANFLIDDFLYVGQPLIIPIGTEQENSFVPTISATSQTNAAGNKEYTVGSTQISPIDGMEMVYVPAGDFLMGSPDGVGNDDEHPQHTVYLDAYWMDKTEVTNAMFEKCVSAGICTPPIDNSSVTRSFYYGNPSYNDYPVIYVDWDQANSYCKWAERALPTEAQWEKAARGENGQTYPWGNESVSGNLTNYADKNTGLPWSDKAVDDNYTDTAPVGTYPDGKSPYGVLDMAGNVEEWVADSIGYYSSKNETNPLVISSQLEAAPEGKRIRGGSWFHDSDDIRTSSRMWTYSNKSLYFLGFRCSLSN